GWAFGHRGTSARIVRQGVWVGCLRTGGLQRLDATTTGNGVIFAVVVEGLIEVIIGAVGVIVGVILRLPSVIHWMEDDIDARLPQTPLRKVHWLEGIVDWHYRTSRKWAPIIMAPS